MTSASNTADGNPVSKKKRQLNLETAIRRGCQTQDFDSERIDDI